MVKEDHGSKEAAASLVFIEVHSANESRPENLDYLAFRSPQIARHEKTKLGIHIAT